MSDIEDFASDVLERAKARSKVLKGTAGKPEPLKVTFGAVENVPIPARDEEDETLEEIDDRLEESPVPNKSLETDYRSREPQIDYANAPVQSAVANLPLSDLNVKMSASPVRRMRLKELASTINGWEDDCTHHVTPTSRFNLNKPQSPQRKHHQPLMTSSPKPVVANVEAIVVVRNAVNENLLSSGTCGISSEACLHTVNLETQSTVLKESLELEIKEDQQDDSNNYSHDSSRSDVNELGDDAICSEGDSRENSELCDSIVFVTSQSDIQNNESEKTHGVDGSDKRTSSKQECILNDSFINALEAQGFVQSPTSSKLVYQYKNPDAKESVPYQLPGPKRSESPVKRAASPVRQTPVYSKSPSPIKNSPVVVVDGAPRVMDLIRKQFDTDKEVARTSCTAERIDADRSIVSVAEKTAMYESKCKSANVKEIDPAELSVAERRKLFENKKNLFQSAPPKDASSLSPNKLEAGKTSASRRPPRPSMIPAQPLKMKLQMFEKGLKEESDDESSDTEQDNTPPQIKSIIAKPANAMQGQPPLPPPLPSSDSPRGRSSPRRSPTRSPMRAQDNDISLTSEDDSSIMPSPVSRCSPRQNLKEVSFAELPKSPKRYSSPSPSGKRSISPKANYPGTRDVKRIKVIDPKPGRIYPSLTDIETTETETDTDVDMGTTAEVRDYHDEEDLESETSTISGSSLGTFIERKAIQHCPLRQSERQSRMKSFEEINASLACQKVDEFIDEALEGQDYSMDTNMDESSPVAASSPLKMASRLLPSTSNLTGNLVHTVSFYRRQQTLNTASPHPQVSTPKRIITIEEEDVPPEERTFSHEDEVNTRIAKLQAEAQAQQRLMAQASKALSLCKATMEFSESRENVECERVLLIATHKHSALVNEIHRLKTEGILGRKVDVSPTKGDLGPSCRGNMTLHDVAIQLKREFLPMAMKGETVYNFIAFVKYRNQLEASSLVSVGNGIESSSVKGGVLYFPNSFSISNLEPDFKVTVEIFVLQTLREFLPHDAKYHIKKDKNKLTPKKTKHDGSKFTHFQHSPAGPDAVQACKFQAVGCLSIDISTLQRSHWQLERVSNSGPLEGSASFKIHCSAEGGVEQRGFLTMFQDISGYGDWHRRWCKLTPSELSFWMYPEDENNEPVGCVSLRSCVTSRVGPVPRDVCARANTFLLVTTRSPQSRDRDTLVMSCHDEYTAVRHLISADTKEERDLWCRQFNRALANLRAWDPHAHSPDDDLF